MSIPRIPEKVAWRNGLVLEPKHFDVSDQRVASLAYISSLVADPWPWGFTGVFVDETALASGQLRIECEGIFPGGHPFRNVTINQTLVAGSDAQQATFHLVRDSESGNFSATSEERGASAHTMPIAKLVFHGGVWTTQPDWSPPSLFIDTEHPMRLDINRQLGALAALAVGFSTTLRLPGAEERPVARVLSQVAAALSQGVGVIQALLASPAVSPGRIGIEALRLALGVRSAARIFDPLDSTWDATDQRGSIRRLLYAAESAASGIGLPFRASAFIPTEEGNMLKVDGMPSESLLLAIEASRPSDLIAGRAWFEGAALASPDRIQEALNRRVAGCARRPIDRDTRIGVSSGPLLALYNVDNDQVWRSGQAELALASKTPPPINTSFSVLIPEEGANAGQPTGGFAPSEPGVSAPGGANVPGGAGGWRGGSSGPVRSRNQM